MDKRLFIQGLVFLVLLPVALYVYVASVHFDANLWSSLFLAVCVDLFLVYALIDYKKIPYRCPNCRRFLTIKLAGETNQAEQFDSVGVAGKSTVTQYKSTYRCQACDHQWERHVSFRQEHLDDHRRYR